MVVKGVLKMAANEMSARSENNRNYLTVCVCVCVGLVMPCFETTFSRIIVLNIYVF